jgi:demethylmenaquinone methyltransferase/2-methoxy-6-polyprenyl-1,4-benzoquinol methylase
MGGIGEERFSPASNAALLSRDEVGSMFDAVAPRYDLLNRVLSLGVDRRWRVDTIRALELRPGDTLIDICGGTGDLAFEAERQVPGVIPLNVDLSRPMLVRYRARAGRRGVAARAVEGDAMRLPIAAGTAQAAVIGFGIRNVPDRLAALTEIHRVLAGGGRLAVLEFALPEAAAIRGPYLLYLRHLMPRMAGLLSPCPAAYRYLGESILAFPKPAEFAALIEQAGFASPRISALSLGIAVRYLATKT